VSERKGVVEEREREREEKRKREADSSEAEKCGWGEMKASNCSVSFLALVTPTRWEFLRHRADHFA
jgi:hypothetical protein